MRISADSLAKIEEFTPSWVSGQAYRWQMGRQELKNYPGFPGALVNPPASAEDRLDP